MKILDFWTPGQSEYRLQKFSFLAKIRKNTNNQSINQSHEVNMPPKGGKGKGKAAKTPSKTAGGDEAKKGKRGRRKRIEVNYLSFFFDHFEFYLCFLVPTVIHLSSYRTTRPTPRTSTRC